MNLKTILSVSILIGLGVIGFRLFNTPTAESSKTELVIPEASVPVQVSVPNLPVSVKPAETIPAIEEKSSEPSFRQYSEKPKDSSVEFELVNDLAVTFGDTVLGKPGSDFKGQRALTVVDHPDFWTQNQIPYGIDKALPHPERIQQAMELFQAKTKLRFVQATSTGSDLLYFTTTIDHCFSYLGKKGGTQPIYLSDGCGPAEISHEIMHALGFIHEQSRFDRDDYLEIDWANIEEKFRPQFAMVPEAWMAPYLNSPFDPQSIMMYDPKLFALKPGQPTMKLKNGGAIPSGGRQLSDFDIERINRIYH